MILLLTGCINPAGMSYTTLINPEERKKQYVDAIHFYLSKTNYPIVFSENSGIDISYCFHDDIKSGRLEVLCFHGNQDKTRGKGYGECLGDKRDRRNRSAGGNSSIYRCYEYRHKRLYG